MSLRLSDDSNSSTGSSRHSVKNYKQLDILDIILWNSVESKLSKFTETFKQYSKDEKIFLLKSRCLSNSCGCVLKNHGIFLAKVFMNIKLIVVKWNKIKFSKTSIPDTEQIAKYIIFRNYNDWLEILNENLEVIPFWSNTSQIARNKPRAFLIRKDTKCLQLKEAVDDVSFAFDYQTVKSGAILSYVNFKRYPIKKGRKVKEQNLIKCKDENEDIYYFGIDEPLYASPIAGSENISGAHTIDSVIDKFHFPINVRSIFLNPPVPNISCSERNYMNLSSRFQLDLIFVMPLNESKRFFIITPGLFDDHYFTIGEFMPQISLKQPIPDSVEKEITNFDIRLGEFFKKCHKYDSLGYLLKYGTDISKVQAKFEALETEFDDIYIEVEDIYFYIRNGYFPRRSVKMKHKPVEIKIEETNENEVNEKVENVKSSSSSSVSSNVDVSTDENNSSIIITTSSESDCTRSSVLKVKKKSCAKSVPLSKCIKSSDANSLAQYNCNMLLYNDYDLSSVGMFVEENADMDSDRVRYSNLDFYKGDHQKVTVVNLENISLKHTAV